MKREGEFALIERLFAPLSRNEAGAFGLSDDAACLKPSAGCEFVVTTDAVVGSVHFLPDDPAETVAQKALRVNLSDLAAKGARPRAYLLTAMLPEQGDGAWLNAFVRGLKRDQKRFGLTLIGGDTTTSPSALAFNIAAIGEVAYGRMILRRGACVGDDIWVSGTIGDAWLGLRAARGDELGLSEAQRRTVVERYRVPQPRVALGQKLVGLASACVDISDGLVADLEHVAKASKVAVELQAQDVPLSAAAGAALAAGDATLADFLTGGDDYELGFTARPGLRRQVMAAAREAKVAVARIGLIGGGKGVRVFDGERPLALLRRGYTHF